MKKKKTYTYFYWPFFKVGGVGNKISLSRLHPVFLAKISYLNFLDISNGLFVADPASLSRLHPLMI